MNRDVLIDVAEGKTKADRIIKGGKLVNVHTREILDADVATKGDRIAYVGDVSHTRGPRTDVIDAKGRYLIPGLIDPHLHTGESSLTINNFARLVVPHGTTGIAADFTEIEEVSGPRGVRFQLDEAKKTPLKVFFFVMQQVMRGGRLGTHPRPESQMALEFEEMLDWPENIGIYEPPLLPVLQRDPLILNLVKKAQRQKKIIEGHYPFPISKDLSAYIVMGASSCHESGNVAAALEKVRQGMRVIIRDCSVSEDMDRVIDVMKRKGMDTRYFMLCTDDDDTLDLTEKGHMDYKLRKAVRLGIDPMVAVQMCTINVAEYFRVDEDFGSISPGKVADIVFVDDLSGFKVAKVVSNGKVVAARGRYLSRDEKPRLPQFMRGAVKVRRPLRASDFALKAKTSKGSATVRVIGLEGGSFIRKWKTATLKVDRGEIGADVKQDVIKIAIVECHNDTGRKCIAFASGIGLKKGAVALTHNHPFNNLIVVGTNDEEMAFAANKLVSWGGGFIAVNGGKVLGELRLPYGGVMSGLPPQEVCEKQRILKESIKSLGCRIRSPFTILSLITIPTIPESGLTDRGLVDVATQSFVSVEV